MASVLGRLKQILNRGGSSGPKWVPDIVYPDDVFVVSYPKSGNTWARFLIANLLKPTDEEVIDFHVCQRYVPEVGKQDDIIQTLRRPRTMKSHAPFVAEYPRLIYLVRDGRDTYVSYYFHQLRQLPQGTTFGAFLKRRDHAPCLWGEHVVSWALRDSLAAEMAVVKYEDLVRDSLGQLRRIADFLGLSVTEDRLQSAVQASSFQSMQRLERDRGRPFQDEGPEVFVRKGQPGNWKEFFGPEEKALFKDREGDVLIRLGYEVDDNW